MRLTYKFYIRHTEEIDKLLRISNNLYNQALYLSVSVLMLTVFGRGITTWTNSLRVSPTSKANVITGC